MADNTDIKNALTFTEPNVFGLPARTIGNPALERIKVWMEADYELKFNGEEATANDFAAFLFRQISAKVLSYESRVAHAEVADPNPLDDTP